MSNFLHITEDIRVTHNHNYPRLRPDELANNGSSLTSLVPWIGLGLGALALVGWLCSNKPEEKPNHNEKAQIDNIFNLMMECFRNAEMDLKNGEDANEIRKGLNPIIDSLIGGLAKDFGKARMAIVMNFLKRLDRMSGNT